MTLESKLQALVAELRGQAETSREEAGRIRRTVHVATEAEANCLIRAEVWDKCADRIEALLAERQPMMELNAEQVALAIAANKLLPDPPGGYDMEGIVKSLNGLLASASALAERQEPPWNGPEICPKCGTSIYNRVIQCPKPDCGHIFAAVEPSSGTGESK